MTSLASKNKKSQPSTASQYQIPILERGLKVLQLFKRTRPHITAPEVARDLETPRSTVHRILRTLEALNFLERVPGNGSAYSLGAAVVTLGFEYLDSLDIVQISNPILSQLRDDLDYSAHLVVLSGTDIVYLNRLGSHSALTSNVSVGSRLPAHATVTGRAILADLSDAELKELYSGQSLKRFTQQTPTTFKRLQEVLRSDKDRGYAVGKSFFAPGVASVAAGVRNATGRVVAAINVTIPEAHCSSRAAPRGHSKQGSGSS